MGVICLWAIVSGMNEVGRRCPDARDTALQAALADGEAALDRYVKANGRMSEADIARFKRQQARLDRLASEICSGDGLNMYRTLAEKGPATVRDSVRELTARPGKPEWGDCL